MTAQRIVRYFLLLDVLQTTLRNRIMTSPDHSPTTTPIPRRPLGRTSQPVTIFGLGGEGMLRTHGREAEAVAVIQRALQQGVNYFKMPASIFFRR